MDVGGVGVRFWRFFVKLGIIFLVVGLWCSLGGCEGRINVVR